MYTSGGKISTTRFWRRSSN